MSTSLTDIHDIATLSMGQDFQVLRSSPLSITNTHNLYSPVILTCTGSGFKLGPVTGEILADMVTGRNTKYDPAPFAASRFQKTGTSKI